MPGAFRYDLIAPGSRVLCALSGGADSVYLLCRLLEGAQERGYAVACAHYNHHLRQSAERDEDFVRGLCRERGVSLAVGGGDVAAQAARLGLGIEDCARRMRYAFLEETADALGCAAIATGHHAGDQAETVLLNLIRGCGLGGLGGIPERRGRLVRPMLAVTREEINAYLVARGQAHVEDETNADLSYARNRIRHQVLPALESVNPRAAEHLCALARRAAEDEGELARQAEGLLARARRDGTVWDVPACVLAQAPRPLAARACRALMERAGMAPESGHIEAALALASRAQGAGALDVPGGRVAREQGTLRFVPADTPGGGSPAPMTLIEGTLRWGAWRAVCAPAVCPGKAYVSPYEFYLRPGEYTVRTRREGDRLRLGSRPEKTVKRLLSEGQVSPGERGLVPVLEGEGRAAALGGFGPDAGFLAETGRECLHIILTKERET